MIKYKYDITRLFNNFNHESKKKIKTLKTNTTRTHHLRHLPFHRKHLITRKNKHPNRRRRLQNFRQTRHNRPISHQTIRQKKEHRFFQTRNRKLYFQRKL